MRRLLMPAFVWVVTCMLLAVCARGQSYGPFFGQAYNITGTCPTQTTTTVAGNATIGFTITGTTISGSNTTVNYTWVRTGTNTNYGVINIWEDSPYESDVVLSPSAGGSGSVVLQAGQVLKLRMYHVLYAGGAQLNCTGPTGTYPGPAQDTIVATGGVMPQDLNWSYTNDKNYTVKLKLVKGGVDTGWTTEVGPNATASGVITGLADATDYTMAIQDPYQFTDGSWVDSGAYITKSTPSVPNPASGTPDNIVPSGTTATTANTFAPTPPTNQPTSAPTTSTTGTTAWTPTTNTVDNERLDKATYRAGVDKTILKLGEIKDAITTTTVTAPETFGDPEETAAALVAGPSITNIMPTTPPTLTGNFTSVHTVSANLTIPGMMGIADIPVNWTYDFSQHESLITIIRNFLLYIITICFFILCVRTAKESSA